MNTCLFKVFICTTLLLLVGCTEQNLALKQELMDLDNEIQSIEDDLSNARKIRATSDKTARALNEKESSTKTETDRVAARLNGLSNDLQELRNTITDLESSEQGYDKVTLLSGEEITCTLDNMAQGTLTFTLVDGTQKTLPVKNITSISLRNTPAPEGERHTTP